MYSTFYPFRCRQGSKTVFDAPSVTVNDISPEERPRSRSHTAGSAACYFLQSDVADRQDGGRVLSATPPSAPPKKRHCRSMSAGETFQPHSFKSKCGCNIFKHFRIFHSPDSPVPRPVSATSWDGSTNPPFWLEWFNSFRPVCLPRTMYAFSSVDDRDRMSESSGSVTSVSSSRSDTLHDMELRNQKVVQRCKSQPCVPVSRHGGGGKKRRRDEEARPKLDFYKMAEVRGI
ncbi:hypothetical protein BSL78_21745 [Apostichopus japonicus]|uniref:Uncharacterized protein n=1 Tax=Stichopus japonicus TaxID=307972 RepID=A0A2G8K064_STIJA|nr:hypothetical protein BSL78_21745 [Apostichopus japonicus]